MELQPIGRELPAEVVLLIFERTQPSRSHSDLVPDPFLPKLALLSKSFLGVARRRLYSDVYLTQHGSLSTKDVVRGFLWALQVQPSLSDLVLGIHYGATRVEEDEIRHVSNAISRVDNLLRLRIFGFDQDYSAIMRINEVVQSRRALQEIEISTFSLTEHYSALFCGLAPFFRMLFLWSNIRSVIIHAQTIGWERSTRLGIEEAILGSCARLTRFIYHCAEYWEDKHLEALVRIAPELEELWLRGVLMSEALTREGLETSLTAWSSSLRQLSLHFPNTEREGDAYKRLHLDKVLVQLPELRLLDLGSAYLQPSSLARGASKLASLRLEIRVNEPHTAELKEVLRDAKALPNLKNLRILPDVKLAFQDAADLFTLCAAREISLEIVGDYSDVKKHLNFHP